MFTIIGSGFGLYGYLPAIINSRKGEVALLQDYRSKIEARPELHKYIQNIIWFSSTELILKQATSVVIAVPPHQQPTVAKIVLRNKSLYQLVIEKPLAKSPKESEYLVNNISNFLTKYRVSYIFHYTDWFYKLVKIPKEQLSSINICWSFHADHFSRELKNWKRYHSIGGGVLRFYGIHLLAILSSLGYNKPTLSIINYKIPDQPLTWSAIFTGPDLPKCSVHINTNCLYKLFTIQTSKIQGNKQLIYSNISPFKANCETDCQDIRVSALELVLESLYQADEEYLKLYEKINRLWLQTEEISSWKIS